MCDFRNVSLHSTRLATGILLGIFVCPAAWAGFCTEDPTPAVARHDFRFLAGYSPVSTTLIGTTSDRRFVLAGFDYSYRCWAWRHASISYTGGLFPAAILLQPAQMFAPSHAVYGFGVTPLGFTLDFGRERKVYPFIETGEGIIASTEPIPENVPGGTGLNFLVDLGGGVRVRTDDRHAITLGYRYLHISNAFTTDVNPGVDNNVFYVGFSFMR
jgi:hypothetical protein